MRQFKPDVLQKIKDDDVLLLDIAQSLGKKFRTVYQWALDNSDQLQVPAVFQMIKERLKEKHGLIGENELLEKEANAA